jgi:hypothetical protein
MNLAYGVSVIQFEINNRLNGSDDCPLASLVERGGFEPPKASPTDLQSVPFGRSGTSPTLNLFCMIEHSLLV